MTRIKNGAVIPTKAPQLVEQALLTDPENRTIEIASNAAINTATGKLKDVADAFAELTAALIANGFMAAGA